MTWWHGSDNRVSTGQKDGWDILFPGISYFFVLWGVSVKRGSTVKVLCGLLKSCQDNISSFRTSLTTRHSFFQIPRFEIHSGHCLV